MFDRLKLFKRLTSDPRFNDPEKIIDITPDTFADKEIFNFEKMDEQITLEKVVKACFLNPYRSKWSCVRYATVIKYADTGDYSSPDKLIELIKGKLPHAVENLEKKNVKLVC